MNQIGQEEPIGFSRLILTTALIAGVFIVWAMFFTPNKPPEQTDNKNQPATAEKASPETRTDAVQPAPPIIPSEPLSADEAGTFKIENGEMELHFSNRGAVLVHAFMKKFKEKGASSQDDLVSPLSEATQSYPLAVLSGDAAYDKAVNEGLFHVEQNAQGLTFKWSDGKGNSVIKAFRVEDKGYVMSFDMSASRDGRVLETVPLIWGPGFSRLTKEQAKNKYYQQEYVGYEAGGKFHKAVRGKKPSGDPQDQPYGGSVSWAGIANNYFTAVFLPEEPISSLKVRTMSVAAELQELHPSETDISMIIETKGRGKLFLGPKDYPSLKGLGGQAFRMMNWGWSWFSAICAFLLWGLNKLYAYTANYGIAILLLTLVMKIFFYPFTQSSMVKMKEMGEAMKKLKPQIDKIRAKYKKIGMNMQTRAKMNEEVMELYKKEGVNPLGGMSGCLPLLLQLPVFWALFTMLPNTIDLRGAHFFLWIKDLSLADPLYITPILMGISMFLSTMMSGTQMTEPTQKVMMYTMPVMFTWFCLWAPAGLTLYWLANNILTMGQQAIINKQVEKRALEAQKAKKSTPKGPSRPSHA
ncbi:MAG TPA: membrane protein insertase YidC [Acidobacteriota bacterium]|nr:membrane protein insertase YidC [Acidobacteriota bacterium]